LRGKVNTGVQGPIRARVPTLRRRGAGSDLPSARLTG